MPRLPTDGDDRGAWGSILNTFLQVGHAPAGELVSTSTASLAQVNVSSFFAGAAALRGLATMNSGTTVVSVSAPAVRSGDVILTQMYMFATAQNSGQNIVTNVESVRAGAFEIRAAGSIAPAANMNLAWFTMR